MGGSKLCVCHDSRERKANIVKTGIHTRYDCLDGRHVSTEERSTEEKWELPGVRLVPHLWSGRATRLMSTSRMLLALYGLVQQCGR